MRLSEGAWQVHTNSGLWLSPEIFFDLGYNARTQSLKLHCPDAQSSHTEADTHSQVIGTHAQVIYSKWFRNCENYVESSHCGNLKTSVFRILGDSIRQLMPIFTDIELKTALDGTAPAVTQGDEVRPYLLHANACLQPWRKAMHRTAVEST